ncbi:putative G-protein coupled receptor 160 [Arapaima gigas]
MRIMMSRALCDANILIHDVSSTRRYRCPRAARGGCGCSSARPGIEHRVDFCSPYATPASAELWTPSAIMQNPIPSLVLVLSGKCLLNWIIVLLQRRHLGWSFLGFLCISLALVDSLLAFISSAIFLLQDVHILNLRITTHHICLLVQMACFMYSLLQWPVFLLIGLDHSWNLALHPLPLHWSRRLCYTLGVILIWAAALLYVLSASSFYPDIGEEFHLLLRKCRVFSSPQSTQVFVVLLLTLACALLHSCPVFLTPTAMGWEPVVVALPVQASNLSVTPKRQLSSRLVLHMALRSFLNAWMPFVVLQIILLLFQVDIPAYLDLNVLWLCFLNSFTVGAVLWSRSQVLGVGKDLVFTDGFCQWDFSSVFADDGNSSTEQLDSVSVYEGVAR